MNYYCTHCEHAHHYFPPAEFSPDEGVVTCRYRHGPDHYTKLWPHGAFRELADICYKFVLHPAIKAQNENERPV